MPKITRSSYFCLLSCLTLLLSACYPYQPEGVIPEAKLNPATDLAWTQAEVDALVERREESIYSPIASDFSNIPAQCQHIHYLRYKLKSASDDSQQADAVLMMMPGIIEGANAFHYFARQLIYMAKTQRNKNIELWAIERRANCLEDLTGFNLAENISDIEQAEKLVIDYYYNNSTIEGKNFEGFLNAHQQNFLVDFGLGLATKDMFSIMQTRMPDQSQRQAKLFVGGHSLGGLHSSVFLSWDQDGSLATINDTGYNNVAGVIGLDALIGDFSQAPQAVLGFLPFPELFVGLSGGIVENSYKDAIDAIKRGDSAAFLEIPGFFTPEILALLEAVGFLADRAPEQEFRALNNIPENPALTNLLNFIQAKDQASFVLGPYFSNFRYTNAAMVGLLFDDNFSALNLLHTSLGFMHGGEITHKSHVLEFLTEFKFLQPIYSAIIPTQDLMVPGNAGASVSSWGTGPLYSWANYDEVASPDKPNHMDIDGNTLLTTLADEMVNAKDFYPALYLGNSNLTEWYFPSRILLDLFAIVYEYGQRYGLNTLHTDKIASTPGIIFKAEQGTAGFTNILLPEISAEIVDVPNMGHLDPMFAVANNPQYYDNPIYPKLLDFIEAHTTAP